MALLAVLVRCQLINYVCIKSLYPPTLFETAYAEKVNGPNQSPGCLVFTWFKKESDENTLKWCERYKLYLFPKSIDIHRSTPSPHTKLEVDMWYEHITNYPDNISVKSQYFIQTVHILVVKSRRLFALLFKAKTGSAYVSKPVQLCKTKCLK